MSTTRGYDPHRPRRPHQAAGEHMEDITEKDQGRDDGASVPGDPLFGILTDESAPLPHVGLHLFMVRVSMKLSPQKASTMLGMTRKQLQDYEVGKREAKGEHRKNILQFINRFAPRVGLRGRNG